MTGAKRENEGKGQIDGDDADKKVIVDGEIQKSTGLEVLSDDSAES